MNKRILNVVGAVLLIIGISIGCGESESKETNSASEKTKVQQTENESSYPAAPDFTLKDLNGNDLSLSDYSGKLIFVNFWATWCPPCRAEVPAFISLYDKYNEQGLEIIGISTDRDGKEVVQRFVDKSNVNYPIVMFDMNVISAYGGITGIPTTFIVNPEGKIVNKFVGYPGEDAFEKEIQKWLPSKNS
jgi:peroxiredoxin